MLEKGLFCSLQCYNFFMVQFPRDFLWGAAASAYQVEGNNVNADWWQWEKEAGKENSGSACRHYELYEQDFDLAKSLNHNAHRLSIEWSRVEPQEGKFSQEEIKHYTDVILALRARGIEPMVTLHHFTNPIWLSASGGWENRACVDRFLRYCEVVVRALGPQVRYWITINEPTIYFSHAYLFGVWPPQSKSYWKANGVYNHLISAHIKAYRLIHKIYKESNLPRPSVSIAHHLLAILPCVPNFINRLAARLRDRWYNFGILDRLMRHNTLDFIGVNYYSRHLVEVQGWGIWNWAMDTCQNNHHPVKKNSLGWDIYPEGLSQVLLKLKKYNLPVIITENGICTSDDDLRWEFLWAHLKNVHLAIKEGVDVQGYFYWSLMDNFEWDKGFGPKFGLVDVDYKTYQRTIRESARKFAHVCRAGIFES